VRRRKCLVQIQVHHIHTEISRPRLADQRVHVRAVHVEQRAFVVQHIGNLVDLALENTNRRGICQHQSCCLFVDYLRQGRHIHATLRIRLQVHHLISATCRRRWIRPMRRVRDNNCLAWIALRLVIRPRHQHASKLAMRSCRRLQRDRVHACDLQQAILQELDNHHRTPRKALGLIWVGLCDALQAGDIFVYPRVVLHRATAQRIHPQIDCVVPRREPCEVPDDFDLAQLR